jgi:DNA polymerase-3 subunit gamma/tau
MAYQVLARKYRPQRFSDVAGQDHVTRTLLNALTQGRVAHGYIFSGHRGIGKTTIARILAMALNCRSAIGSAERPTPEPCEVCESCTEIRAGNAVDVIEIDAATNRGIDEIRELRDAARYRPARDRYKIYILDEAHQITDAAFNALLKTLEEPPDHVVFMMATTQPEDIPQTIRSRSQHFSFHAVSFEDILKELQAIALKENVGADEKSLSLLAEAGDGSMRDALSIMDQAIASAPVEDGKAVLDADQIRELMGTVPNTVFERILEQISENQSAAVMQEANSLLNAGNSPSQIARQFVRYLRNCLMAKLGGENTPLLEISADERARASRSAVLFTEEDLTRFLQVMLRTFDELNYRQEPRFHLELGLMKLVHLQRLIPMEELLGQLRGGAAASVRPSGAVPTGSRPIAGLSAKPAAPRVADAVAEKPSFSPFEVDRNRKRGMEEAHTQRVEKAVETAPTIVSQAPFRVESAVAVVEPEPVQVGVIEGLEENPEVGLSVLLPDKPVRPATNVTEEEEEARREPVVHTHTMDRLRDAVAQALEEKGHQTAAALLTAGAWRHDGELIEVQIAVKKLMLGLVMNPEADKIARTVMREQGFTGKLQVLPGEGTTGGTSARQVAQGSVQAQALENPLVKQAQELFRAEVRSILDLRDKR